jgi:hypothetical protein
MAEEKKKPTLIKKETLECLGEVRLVYGRGLTGPGDVLQQKWMVRHHYSDGSHRTLAEWKKVERLQPVGWEHDDPVPGDVEGHPV